MRGWKTDDFGTYFNEIILNAITGKSAAGDACISLGPALLYEAL